MKANALFTVREASESDSVASPSALDDVLPLVDAATVALSSGRRYEIEAHSEGDRLVVRGAGGDVVLRIEVGERGPILRFEAVELALKATRRVSIDAESIDLHADLDISIETGGSLRERIEGHHHTRVGGDERLEAARVEVQAAEGNFEALAMRSIRLDGETVGLNGKAAPAPFEWSELANEEGG